MYIYKDINGFTLGTIYVVNKQNKKNKIIYCIIRENIVTVHKVSINKKNTIIKIFAYFTVEL